MILFVCLLVIILFSSFCVEGAIVSKDADLGGLDGDDDGEGGGGWDVEDDDLVLPEGLVSCEGERAYG